MIYLGKFRGAAVAIKELKLNANSKTKTWEELRTELRIMISLVHPNVVSLKGYCVDPYCLVLEYVPCGDLYNVRRSKVERKKEEEAKRRGRGEEKRFYLRFFFFFSFLVSSHRNEQNRLGTSAANRVRFGDGNALFAFAHSAAHSQR